MADFVAGRGTTGMSIAGLVTGITGTVGALGGLAGLMGNPHSSDPDARFITKSELSLTRENDQLKVENGILKADQAAEVKMQQVYEQAHREVVKVEDKLDALKDQVWADKLEQATVNAKVSDAISVNSSAIATLNTIIGNVTKVGIPTHAVTMPAYPPVPPVVPAII